MNLIKKLFRRRRKKVQNIYPEPTTNVEDENTIITASTFQHTNTQNAESIESSGCDGSCESCSCRDSDSGGFGN